MNRKTEIFALEDGRVLQWASERPGRQQGIHVEGELLWSAPLYSSISLFSLPLSSSAFCPPTELASQAYSIPQPPLLTQNGFLALHKHCFLFLHPNPKFLGKGTLGGPVPWGRCLLPAPATLAMGQGWEHLTKKAVWSPSPQNSEWVYQELCRAGDF